jgi:hypothetical protein
MGVWGPQFWVGCLRRRAWMLVTHPNDFTDLNGLAERLLDFQYYWETTARPFQWKFTRHDLARFLSKVSTQN